MTCPPSVFSRRLIRKVPGLTAFSRMTTPSRDGSRTTLCSLPKCTSSLQHSGGLPVSSPRGAHTEGGCQDSCRAPLSAEAGLGSSVTILWFNFLGLSCFSDWPKSFPPSTPSHEASLFIPAPGVGVGWRAIDNLIKSKINHPRTCPKPSACIFVRNLVSFSTMNIKEGVVGGGC